MKTGPPDKESMSTLDLLKANAEICPGRRKPTNVAIIADVVRKLNYFKSVEEAAGVKMLYEYCKYLELVHLSASVGLSSSETFYIVYTGRIVCRNKQAILRDYTDGEQIGTTSPEVEFRAKQATYLIAIGQASLRRLTSMEQGVATNQRKNFEQLIKKNEKLPTLLTQLKQCNLFRNIPTYDLREFVMQSIVRPYKKGQLIYEEGKFPRFLYLVLVGQVSVTYRDPLADSARRNTLLQKKSAKLVVTVANEYELFGLEELLEDVHYSGTASPASFDVQILQIAADLFKEVVNPLYMKGMCEGLTTLIESRKMLLEKYKQAYSKRKDNSPTKQTDIMEKLKMNDRLNGLPSAFQQPKGQLRSSPKERPYRCYLPPTVLHKNQQTFRFTGPPQKMSLGLIEQEMRKAGTRTLSPFQEQKRPRLDPIEPKHVYQRIIINKLEQYETLDQLRLVEEDENDDRGSTLNLYRTRRKSNLQRIYQPLSVSYQKEPRTLKLAD